jgi:hypothetical protein
MPTEAEGLNLFEALQAFCDPDLFAHWQEVQRLYLPPPDRSVRYSRNMEVLARRRRAQRALLADLRSRVASGEVVLEGLQIGPGAPAIERSRVPALWGPLLQFNFKKDIVGARGAEFALVRASRAVVGIAPVASSQPAHAPPAEDFVAVEHKATRRAGGRGNFAPMIEALLREMWEQIQRRLEETGRKVPVWSELARTMEKRLKNAAANNGKPVPHVDTIRTRLPEIYERVLSEKIVQL